MLCVRFRWWFVALLALAGCTKLVRPSEPLVAPVKMAPDSVVLEVFSLNISPNDAQAARLWAEIDEQPFPVAMRRRLAEAGFRVGVTGGRIPVALERLMQLDEAPASESADTAVVDFMSDGKVRRRILQVRSGWRGEIIASTVYPAVPVFTSGPDQLVAGRSYADAQGRFVVRPFLESDDRVRIELLPELHHGENRQKWVLGEGGSGWLEAGRDRMAFNDLMITARLEPGQLLLLTCQPDHTGALGHYFFRDPTSGHGDQKLLLVRLAQTQYADGLAVDR